MLRCLIHIDDIFVVDNFDHLHPTALSLPSSFAHFLLLFALSHDYPVIMGILIIGAFLTLIGNMFADLILLKLNPNYKGK